MKICDRRVFVSVLLHTLVQACIPKEETQRSTKAFSIRQVRLQGVDASPVLVNRQRRAGDTGSVPVRGARSTRTHSQKNETSYRRNLTEPDRVERGQVPSRNTPGKKIHHSEPSAHFPRTQYQMNVTALLFGAMIRRKQAATTAHISSGDGASQPQPNAQSGADGVGVTDSRHFVLSTARVARCLLSRSRLSFAISSGGIYVDNLAVRPDHLKQNLVCKVKFKVPDDQFMSIQINSTNCQEATFSYTLRETGRRYGLHLFNSVKFCENLSQEQGRRFSQTVYTSVGATFILDLHVIKGRSPHPFTLSISLTSVPQFHRLLHVQLTSPLHGSVSTPNWNGVTSSLLVMNTWVMIAIPADHNVMVSIFHIDLDEINLRCFRTSFVGLYEHPASKPLAVFCRKRIPRPSAYSSLSCLYVRFVNHFEMTDVRSTGFKLHFSFSTSSAALVQRADGEWNCSVPRWSEFRHHFPCNHQADCIGREDEAPCPYTTPSCGVGRLTIAGRCFMYLRISGKDSFDLLPLLYRTISWSTAEEKCRKVRGHLASLRTFQEMQGISSFFSAKGTHFNFVGLVPVSISNLLYRYVRKTLDDSIIHYTGFQRLNCHSRDSSGTAIGHGQDSSGTAVGYSDVVFLNRKCPLHQDGVLCEVPATATTEPERSKDKLPPAVPSVSEEQDLSWWNESAYVTCPDGHKTHAFLACDVHSKCWTAGGTSSVSCSGAVRSFPPSMTCDGGLQRVPYTLVCDHHHHCHDHADEDFCVFASCDVLSHFQCSNKECLPFKLLCDGVAHCTDASDELMCNTAEIKPSSIFYLFTPTSLPLLVVFDGLGHSAAMSLNQQLILNNKQVNGIVVEATLTHATVYLMSDTLTGRMPEIGALVSGILANGFITNGTLVRETQENGTLVSTMLNKIPLVKGKLVGGTLLSIEGRSGPFVAGTVGNVTLASCSVECPDTHYHCTDEEYCLPMFTRCNNMYDCPGREDEAGCDSYQCPGFYRCRGTSICVHKFDLCDGVKHCPQKDDELLCDRACPEGCTCYGLASFCSHAAPVALHPQLRYLDASDSGMSVNEVRHNTMLVYLSLVRCNVSDWAPVTLPNLRSLDLSSNDVTVITSLLLRHLPNLRHLILAHNPLSSDFLPALESGWSFPTLGSLDMSGVFMPQLDATRLGVLPSLQKLNLTGCGVDRVLGDGLQSLPQLRVLDLGGCPLTFFPGDLLRGLGQLVAVRSENFKLCCPAMLPEQFYLENCKAPSDEVSSCETLLRSHFFRVCLCVFAVLSCVGNSASLFFRMKIVKIKHRSGFDTFVSNLCAADFLMGVFLAIIGVADRLYMGAYLWNDNTWRHSASCKVAGFLSLLSSEVSAFVICLITVDRFLVLRFPFSQFRFNKTSAFLASIIVWIACFVIAAVPLLPLTSHWQFYSQTGICIPLPITRTDFKGHDYSFSVMIVLNFALFVVVALGQLLVYVSVQAHKMPSIGDTAGTFNRDHTLARRLITVAVSDFLCWFPIGLAGVMAANGYDVPAEANTAMAIFVLPLNSAINPFLYTLNIMLEKSRHSREKRIKQYLLSQLNAQGATSTSRACVSSGRVKQEGRQPCKS